MTFYFDSLVFYQYRYGKKASSLPINWGRGFFFSAKSRLLELVETFLRKISKTEARVQHGAMARPMDLLKVHLIPAGHLVKKKVSCFYQKDRGDRTTLGVPKAPSPVLIGPDSFRDKPSEVSQPAGQVFRRIDRCHIPVTTIFSTCRSR